MISLSQLRKRGFTLVEVLVYLGILLVVSLASVTFLFSLDDLVRQYRVETALYRSGTNVMEQAIISLRQANELVTADSVLNDGTLGKLVVQNGGVATEVARSGNDVALTVDDVSKGSLLLSGVTTTGFTVYSYSTGVGTLVRIRLELTATVDGVTKTLTWYGGAVIRGDL